MLGFKLIAAALGIYVMFKIVPAILVLFLMVLAVVGAVIYGLFAA